MKRSSNSWVWFHRSCYSSHWSTIQKNFLYELVLMRRNYKWFCNSFHVNLLVRFNHWKLSRKFWSINIFLSNICIIREHLNLKNRSKSIEWVEFELRLVVVTIFASKEDNGEFPIEWKNFVPVPKRFQKHYPWKKFPLLLTAESISWHCTRLIC